MYIVFRKGASGTLAATLDTTPERAMKWARQAEGWTISRPYWIDIPENAFEPMVDGVLALREVDEVGKIAAAVGGES